MPLFFLPHPQPRLGKLLATQIMKCLSELNEKTLSEISIEMERLCPHIMNMNKKENKYSDFILCLVEAKELPMPQI